MPKKISKLLRLTLETLIWKELFNFKFFFSSDPLFEYPYMNPLINTCESPCKQTICPSSPKALTNKLLKLRLKKASISTELKKNNENQEVEPKEICKQKPMKDKKITKISKPGEISDDDQESHENDPPSEENLPPLQVYAKYYRERLQSLPKKRERDYTPPSPKKRERDCTPPSPKKRERDCTPPSPKKRERNCTPPSPKIIGKQREVFKAFGNEINLYKQTKFIDECQASNFVIDELNFDEKQKERSERKKVFFMIDKPKIPYIILQINKFSANTCVDSFEKILQRIRDRKSEQSCGVDENPENNND